MDLRAAGASLVLGLTVSAAPALASVAVVPPVRAQLTIDYFPPAIPGNPVFGGSELTGQAQFFVHDDAGFRPEGAAIDIGRIAMGDGSVFKVFPPDPCVGQGTCQLQFSFGGQAAGFPAFALGATDPSAEPPPDPDKIPLGIPGNPIIPGNPVHGSGRIYAWDAPVPVGTWSVTLSSAPEPAEWALMLVGLSGLGVACRSRRRAAVS
jgi:hypothetical protein